jgi:hypothetical protein
MSNNETWIDTAEKIALFRNQGKGDDATRLLEISPTNRTIAGRKQAILLATLRFAASYYTNLYPENKTSYIWIDQLCDNIEEYQLTLDGEQNSRRQFIKVAIGNIIGMFKAKAGDKSEVITK